MKKIIREKETWILFIIGFSLSFFIALNGIQLINEWYVQMVKSQTEEEYRNSISISINKELNTETITNEEAAKDFENCKVEANDILEVLYKQSNTTYLDGIGLPLGEEAQYEEAKVVLVYNEEWYQTLASGRYPTEKEIETGEKVVVISESAKQYMKKSGNDYKILINGEEYRVCGILENYKASGYDMEIVCFYSPKSRQSNNIITEKVAEALYYGWDINVSMGSNQHKIDGDVEKLIENLQSKFPFSITPTEYIEGNDEIAKFYGAIKGVVLTILFIISMLNCVQITKLWMTRKQKELIILKTFGFSNSRIVGKVIGELMQIAGLSASVIIILDVIYLLFFHKNIQTINLYLMNAGFLLAIFIFVILIALEPIIQNVKKIEPAKGLREL